MDLRIPARIKRHPLVRDARHFQIIFLGAFLIYGILNLGWDVELDGFLTVIAVCVATQFVFIKRIGLPLSGLKSALITSLGLCLLLKAGSISTLVLASVLAISSKFLLRWKGKHIFNPGNFGIVLAVLLTGDAWVSPGQWGTDITLVYFFAAAALMVLLHVGRIDTSLTFLLVFALAEVARSVLFLGWGMDVVVHKLINGSLLLYAFFMITDPVTTPDRLKARMLWSIMIALLSFGISNWAYVHTAPIWALFAVSALTPVFDRIWKGRRFQWVSEKTTTQILQQ
jgi:Na+-transporting NADH:ubiquinone oxidoreductase subunit NqrB